MLVTCPKWKVPYMNVNFAHLRQRAASGGWINFCVFDARSVSGSDTDNAQLLARLTAGARAQTLRVDQSALAFASGNRVCYFGSPLLVAMLSRGALPRWTRRMAI